VSTSARQPAAPYCSKKAACGLTQAAVSATAAMTPAQNAVKHAATASSSTARSSAPPAATAFSSAVVPPAPSEPFAPLVVPPAPSEPFVPLVSARAARGRNSSTRSGGMRSSTGSRPTHTRLRRAMIEAASLSEKWSTSVS